MSKSIFRVRNLLIQVLPRECEFVDSGGGDGGDGGDTIVDCGDTGECIDSGCGDSCDVGDSGCGNSCDVGDSGCGNSCDVGDSGCGASCDVGDSGGGCGITCDVGDSGCGNDVTQGCPSPDTACPAGTNTTGCDAGTSACTAFDCSLHFDTICGIESPTRCDVFSGCDINSFCRQQITLTVCQDGSNCDVLVSLPLCPDILNTQCVVSGVVVGTRLPVGVCFQSNEPKLNPNSLADLGVLRRQLAAGLRNVLRRERALSKALAPRTAQQIETAEAHLSSALRHLKERKHFVQSRAAASKKAVASKKAAPAKAVKKAPAKKGRKR